MMIYNIIHLLVYMIGTYILCVEYGKCLKLCPTYKIMDL